MIYNNDGTKCTRKYIEYLQDLIYDRVYTVYRQSERSGSRNESILKSLQAAKDLFPTTLMLSGDAFLRDIVCLIHNTHDEQTAGLLISAIIDESIQANDKAEKRLKYRRILKND